MCVYSYSTADEDRQHTGKGENLDILNMFEILFKTQNRGKHHQVKYLLMNINMNVSVCV